MKVTFRGADGQLGEASAEGGDYEAARAAADAQLPEGAQRLAIYVDHDGA